MCIIRFINQQSKFSLNNLEYAKQLSTIETCSNKHQWTVGEDDY